MSTGRKFIDRTKYLLDNRPRSLTYAQICADTGLTAGWLIRFVQLSETHDFGVTRIEKLHDYLQERIKAVA